MEARQLYSQEKTTSGKFQVKKVMGTLNPTDVMTKIVNHMTLERQSEKMGLELWCAGAPD